MGKRETVVFPDNQTVHPYIKEGSGFWPGMEADWRRNWVGVSGYFKSCGVPGLDQKV